MKSGRGPGDIGNEPHGELLERIRTVSRQKGELHQPEFEFRAQMMAIEIQGAFELSLGEQNKELATLRCLLDS
ncbi:hypothetical protein YC2023_015413 [Brassica napus]